ncbi:MAG: hypothetical protein SO361_04820 [Lachnospira sp.]|nr:hypothetical protein [Lachnospira sp.]
MRVTSQMLAQNQLKAGLDSSSKTLLDYIQSDDNDSLTSLLTKKTESSTSSLTKKLQKDAYQDIKDSADSLTETSEKFTDTKSTAFADAEKTGDYSGIYADIKAVIDSYNKLHDTLGKTESSINTMCSELLKEAAKENSEDLSSVGITLKDDGTLVLDEKKLKAADKDTLKKAFGTSSEFAKRLGYIGSNVSSLAKANIKYVTNSYTSSGISANSSDDLYSLMSSKFNSLG